jgi:hypothetical protein
MEDVMLQLRETYSRAIDHDQPDDCSKLIRKLRWIGLEEEANRLQQMVRTLPPEERGCVAAEPYSTD